MDNNSSPIKLRKKKTPIRQRGGEQVEIIDTTSLDVPLKRSPSRSRRLKKTRATMCMMLWGATAFFGVSTITILASRQGAALPQQQQQQQQAATRRRLGITVVQPIIVKGVSPIQTFFISESVRDELYQQVFQLKVDTSSLQDLESFMDSTKEIVQSLVNPDILEALRDIHNTSSPTLAVLFRNLPVDPYIPPNPTDGRISLNKPTYVAEAMLCGFGELVGTIIGYTAEPEYSNPWIHEGFPRATGPGSALTKASDLSFHQDMSYHPKAPDILGLVSVREGHDHDVQTELIDNRKVLEMLPDSIVAMLREPRFRIKTSDWVDTNASIQKSSDDGNTRGILTGAASLAIPVDWENLVGLDSEADWAVQMLQRAILEAPKHYIHFVPGDLLFFNNKRTVHARTPYTDLRYDGGDRVLSRAYFISRKDSIMTMEERQTRMM